MKAGRSSRRVRQTGRRTEERTTPAPPVQEARSAPVVRRAPIQAAEPPPRPASPITILPAQPIAVRQVDPAREPLVYSKPAQVVDREVIQRDVGFEFETDVPVETASSSTSVPYGVVLFTPKAGGWEIKSDNSKIEFVTEKVEDSRDGRQELGRRMDQLVTWAKAMCASSQQPGTKRIGRVAPSMGDTYTYQSESVVLGKSPLAEDEIIAAPQATGGVTLDKIPSLITRMMETRLHHLKRSRTFEPMHEAPQQPQPSGDEFDDQLNQEMFETKRDLFEGLTKPLLRNIESRGYGTQDISYSVGGESLFTALYPIEAKKKVEDWLDQVDGLDVETQKEFAAHFGFPASEVRETTRNLQGLLTLVISYLIGGSKVTSPAPYSKAIATLMSRTNFYQLYRLLSEREKKFFDSEGVLTVADLEDGPVFAKGFYVYNESKQKVLRPGPSRSEWITSIVEGTPVANEDQNRPHDMMSEGSGTDVPRSSSSMGAQNPDVNYRNNRAELAVLELRNIPKKQGIDDWKTTAMTIFEMFRDVNMTPEQRIEADAYLREQARRAQILEEQASKARGMRYAYRF